MRSLPEILKKLLSDRNFIFFLAMVLGMLAHHGATWTQPLILPILGAVMTLSVLSVPNSVFRHPKQMFAPALIGIVLTYLVLSGCIIALSYLIIQDPVLRAGFIIIAAVPPAVANLPINSMLKGDEPFMLFAVIGSYLAALLILPLVISLFLDIQNLNMMHFSATAGGLVFLPLAVSRFFIWRGWHRPLEPVKGRITDWLFFVVIYTIIARNRDIILDSPGMILPVAFVGFVSIFLLGAVIEHVGRRFRLAESMLTPIILLGTLKHFGLSGGIALSFFDTEAALPSAICVVFMVLNVIWLSHRKTSTGQ